MTWNYSQSGDWQLPTIKTRKNGQWIAIGSIDDTISSGEFDWIDPPERSDTEYTSNYSSIQNALNSISSDTELVIDDGPYTESFRIPGTNHITLSGGSSGATINNPGGNIAQITSSGWSLNRTSCGSINEGDITLSVGNASQFSPGDDVRIHDSSDIYKGMTDDELRNTYNQYMGEFGVVASVDSGSGTITLKSGVHQQYSNPSGDLEVAVIDWAGENFHFHNITVDGGVSNPSDRGSSTNYRGLSLNQWKNIWITDSTFENFNKDGTSCGENLNMYVENCHVENVDRYGYSHSDGLTHLRMQNCTGANLSRYLIQCGGGATSQSDVSAPTYDILARNCHLDNSSYSSGEYLGDAHFGAERVEYRDCSSTNANTMQIRGFDQHVLGGEYDAGGSTAVQTTQIVGQSSLEGVYVENGSRGWNIWPKEGHPITDITMKDCQFENMSAAPFRFRTDSDGNPANVNNLQVINSSWNGEWIDDQMIQNSDGTFDSSTIDYTTSYPSNQTPAEYFE